MLSKRVSERLDGSDLHGLVIGDNNNVVTGIWTGPAVS